MHEVFIAFGTNLGNKEQNIATAYEMIEARVGKICRKSSLMQTAPWGFESENEFINSVIMVETQLSPMQLLHETQAIEREMGRTSKSVNGVYHDRIIDIDLLTYDDITLNTPELVLPHPLMMQRDFVRVPYEEIKE